MRALHEPAPPSRPSRPHRTAFGASPAAVSRVPAVSVPPRSAKAASARPLSRIAKAANGFAKPDRERSRHRPSIVTPRPPAASLNVRAHALAEALRASPASALLLAKMRQIAVIFWVANGSNRPKRTLS